MRGHLHAKLTQNSTDFTTRSKMMSPISPMLKDRIAELKAIRDQARADAARAQDAIERLGPGITPQACLSVQLS